MLWNKFSILLCILLMMPQWVETMYSPILTEIQAYYQVSAEQSSLTLSLYFVAFAFGIVFWGYCCDRYGRRPTVLVGMSLYLFATIAAYYSVEFIQLLIVRLIAAFAIAVASIATQTIIRDRFSGQALAQFFAVVGIFMAISPALGMLVSAQLTLLYDYRAVFSCLSIVAVILLFWCVWGLPETRPAQQNSMPFVTLLGRMLCDKHILNTAILIALFNLNVFAYYQLAPFHFQQMQLSVQDFGYSGLLLSLGVATGAGLNQYGLKKGYSEQKLLCLAALISVVAALLALILIKIQQAWFSVSALLILMGYAIAIPNLLASALTQYQNSAGRAGALLGLFYYSLLGVSLIFSGWGQHLAWTLLLSVALIIVLLYRRFKYQYS